MAAILLRAASHVYLSTDAWRRYLAPYAPGSRSSGFVTLPVPSTIPGCDRIADIAERRRQLLGASTRQLVGHFGTVGPHVAPLLEATLLPLLTTDPNVSAVCLGTGTDEFVRALVANVPMVRDRIHGAGRVSRSDAALTLNACDLLVQPYPDGVTTRRTSVMAGLLNGRAIVTTTGHLTEPVWAESGAVALAAATDIESLVATVRTRCSPKTMTALRSRSAARRPTASVSRSTTRFARFERPSKARRHECGRRHDRHHDAQSARGARALSEVAGVRVAPVTGGARVRRCLVGAGARSGGGLEPALGRARPARRSRAGLHRRPQPAGARGGRTARVAHGR